MKRIASKLTLSIGIVTLIFTAFLLYQAYALTNRRIKEVVEQQTSMALQFDLAIRKYVGHKIRPLMYRLVGEDEFIPEAMSTSYVDRPLRRYDDVKTGEYVVFGVSDDGPGIYPDDLERIFEPFYNKKVMGRSGTGLGLAVVWNVVQDHQGYIDVKSSENGTTFELYFPITRMEVSEKDLTAPVKNLVGKGETILIVDDEEDQREISSKMLEPWGIGHGLFPAARKQLNI